MELALLGLIGVALGVIILVGSIAGFFGMFSSSDKAKKLYQLEQETEKLRKEMVRINAQIDALKASSAPAAPMPAATLKVADATTVAVAVPEPIVESVLENPVVESAIPAVVQPTVKLEPTTKKMCIRDRFIHRWILKLKMS